MKVCQDKGMKGIRVVIKSVCSKVLPRKFKRHILPINAVRESSGEGL
jgi:hypothetical protein